jgi:SAM-dependent methyltransferase
LKLLQTLYGYIRRISAYARFCRDYRRFAGLSRRSGKVLPLAWSARMPCLGENTATTSFDRHYIYHLAWAARILEGRKPAIHVDISSSLYFAAIVSAFVPVRFYDFRPAELNLENLQVGSANLHSLPFADRSIESLSCMHVIEHVGLGRYGDALDPDGDVRAMEELLRVLAPGGILYLVVPVGRPRIIFNAHRIYSFEMIMTHCTGMELLEFALVPDEPECGGLVRDASIGLADAQHYGCGCFLFRRNDRENQGEEGLTATVGEC